MPVGAIEFLKFLNNKAGGNVKLSLATKRYTKINTVVQKTNLNLFEIEKKTNLCVFFATNLKVEAAILNFRLKLKYKKNLISIFGFGRAHINDLDISFAALAAKKTLKMFAAKTQYSCILLKASTPLFVLGRTFYDRFSSLASIKNKCFSFF